MKKYEDVEGFNQLSDEQQALLISTHTRHLSAWESESRKQEHSIDQMRQVKWDDKEKCLKVYYETEWYHYDTAGAWY